MCNFHKMTRHQKVTGFKVAIVSNQNFYSPATGIKYKIGPVTVPCLRAFYTPPIHKHPYFCDVLSVESPAHIKGYKGYTAVFRHFYHAYNLYTRMISRSLEDDPKLVILKMTVSEEIWKGDYAYCEVYLGKNIVSLEQCSLKNCRKLRRRQLGIGCEK